jgi:hypothetical protein
MRILATPKTAAVAGLWTVLGGLLLESLGRINPSQAYDYAVAAIGVLFFFVPVLLFVIGPGYIQLVLRNIFSRQLTLRTAWTDRRFLWKDIYSPLLMRMLCWFASGGAATLAYAWMRRRFG